MPENQGRPHRVPLFFDSCRSASAGSTRNAWTMGEAVASAATSESTHATTTKFIASVGRTSGTRNMEQRPHGNNGKGEADARAGRNQPATLDCDYPQNACRSGTESNANPDLPDPAADRIQQHAREPDRHQRQSEQGHRPENPGAHPAWQERKLKGIAYRPGFDRDAGIEIIEGSAHRVQNIFGRPAGGR